METAPKHFIDLESYSGEALNALLELAAKQKADPATYRKRPVLKGRVVGLIFEKPSLRTRLSFETAAYQLGGQVTYLGPESGRLGQREALKDVALVSARYLDALVLRTMKHETIVELARHSAIPVINALSDASHPCQALGDLLTIREKLGRLKDVKIAYVGDANNVCRSLTLGALKCGARMSVASPKGYALDADFVRALGPEAALAQESDPARAVRGAEVIYTDVWTSMGQEDEAEARRKIFRPYQINAELLAQAPEAIVMHCLPAHRGEEISAEVMDGPRAVVYDQAENRLHAQRALFTRLLG